MADHICPWWMGYLLVNPFRRLLENPDKLLGPYVNRGMTVVDYGCGMGFFTLALARMVGPEGKVLAVDVQQKMLDGMVKRSRRAGLADRIVPLLADSRGAGIGDAVDFIAALHVVHELPDAKNFFSRMREAMKPGARLLVVEPGFHVSAKDFRASIEAARSVGLVVVGELENGRRRRALLQTA
ncbi:MAG: methyltransferase domain-containing protein [Desulfomonilaceae bacterium]|nr:methyltransferase domain-containing protein [Desulfomonilaceae bacterium]